MLFPAFVGEVYADLYYLPDVSVNTKIKGLYNYES